MAEPALAEALGVEQLVAPAGPLGVGDQQRGLSHREDLAQRVGSGAGDQHVGAGIGVGHLLVQVFPLGVVGGALVHDVQVGAGGMEELEVVAVRLSGAERIVEVQEPLLERQSGAVFPVRAGTLDFDDDVSCEELRGRGDVVWIVAAFAAPEVAVEVDEVEIVGRLYRVVGIGLLEPVRAGAVDHEFVAAREVLHARGRARIPREEHREAPQMTRYVIWDWNGTLLDDTAAALETLNDMLAKRGSPEIGMEFYRDNITKGFRPPAFLRNHRFLHFLVPLLPRPLFMITTRAIKSDSSIPNPLRANVNCAQK